MKKIMGFWRCWGLVVGIMIGNGIFMLPAVLAPYGRLSLFGWLLAGVGTIFIALMFGLLAKRKPSLGGPYAYTRDAFGDLAGFLVGWGYWIGILAAVAAGSVAITGYLGFFIPEVVNSPLLSATVSLSLIWLITGINIAGVKTAITFQLISSLFKILPLFVIAAGGLWFGDFSISETENIQSEATLSNFAEMVMIIMWAYIGVEAVTLPSNDMQCPEKNIPRALIVGTLSVTFIYLLVSYAVMSLVSSSELAESTSPLADAASAILGPWGAALIAIGGLISIISSTNANIFIVGVMPQAMAQNTSFPLVFSKLNSDGVPATAILFSGVIASVLVAMNFSEGLIGAFKTLILLSTLATVLPYVASSAAELVMQRKDNRVDVKIKWWPLMMAALALVFSIFAIIGSGLAVIMQGTILLIAGLPFYFWSKRQSNG